MGKNISPTLSSPSLPIVNCLEVERHVKLPPLHGILLKDSLL